MKFISNNGIGDVGAAKLGASISKLMKLNSLNLEFR
jgi:hypothetical protein